MMQERAPRIKFSSGFEVPARMAFRTYNGDVPISPKTIPRVIRAPARLNFEIWPVSDENALLINSSK